MSILYNISVLKELPRTIKNIIFDSEVTCKPFTLLEEFPFGFLSSFLFIAYHCRNLEVIIQHKLFRSIYNLIIFFYGP